MNTTQLFHPMLHRTCQGAELSAALLPRREPKTEVKTTRGQGSIANTAPFLLQQRYENNLLYSARGE